LILFKRRSFLVFYSIATFALSRMRTSVANARLYQLVQQESDDDDEIAMQPSATEALCDDYSSMEQFGTDTEAMQLDHVTQAEPEASWSTEAASAAQIWCTVVFGSDQHSVYIEVDKTFWKSLVYTVIANAFTLLTYTKHQMHFKLCLLLLLLLHLWWAMFLAFHHARSRKSLLRHATQCITLVFDLFEEALIAIFIVIEWANADNAQVIGWSWVVVLCLVATAALLGQIIPLALWLWSKCTRRQSNTVAMPEILDE
jgi:hypothetical protein